MTSFDFMPDAEFHPIFDRISKKINLQGCATSEEINSRLKHKIYEIKQTCETGLFGPFLVLRRRAGLRTLIATGFAERCIDEATAQPKGVVALTLKYGRKNAELILTRRKRIM